MTRFGRGVFIKLNSIRATGGEGKSSSGLGLEQPAHRSQRWLFLTAAGKLEKEMPEAISKPRQLRRHISATTCSANDYLPVAHQRRKMSL